MKIILHKDWFKIKNIPRHLFDEILNHIRRKYEKSVSWSFLTDGERCVLDVESTSGKNFTSLYSILNELTDLYEFELL